MSVNVKDELDKLLQFYSDHRPEMLGKPVQVYLTRGSVAKFA